MPQRLKSSTLADFSDKLVRWQEFPRGTEVRLYKRNTERRVRSDFLLKRKAITSKSLPRLPDSQTVMRFLADATHILSTDIKARGIEMKLYSPDGTRINGNTLLGTVRAFEPRFDDEDREEAVDLFFTLLENCGLEDISYRQAGRLYRQLDDILDRQLETSLLKRERDILAASL